MLLFFRIIGGLLLLLSLFSLSSSQACSTLPLSVSDLNICEDNSCRTTETAQLRLGINKGTTECVRIESTGSQVLPSLFNITIMDSVLSYPLVNCYFSDDPTIELEGFCGCPGGTTVSCNNCPAPNTTSPASICTSGLHNSKGCFLGGAGTWCTKIGFTGVNRFKICDLGDPEVQISFEYFDTKELKIHTVTNPNLVTLSNSIFNLTLLNPIIGDKQKPEFMVWDLNQKENFYLIPDKYVNSDVDYDPFRLGWFKTNKSLQITNKFFDSTNVQINSCSQNDFKLGIAANFFSDFLNNHPEFCAQRVSPGAILRDPGFSDISSSKGETVLDTTDLKEGKYFESITGDVIAVGIDSNSIAYPEVVWWANGWTIDTNQGAATGNFMCSNGTTIWKQSDMTTQIITCQLNSDNNVWGPCIVQQLAPPSNTQYICTEIQFPAFDWPNGGIQTWTFNRTFIKTSNEPPSVIERSDSVVIPIKQGFIDILLEFKNVTFVFDTINAIPRIDSVEDSDSDILVVASSKTVPGNCVLMISDDLGPTVSIYLALVNNKYRLPITRKRFEGDAIISIQCFKNKDAVSFKIDVNRADPEINEKSINSSSIRAASMSDPSAWKRFVSVSSKMSSFLGGIFSTVFDLTGNKIGSFFLGLLIVLSIIILIPILLIILYKILVYLISFIKNKMKRKESNDREGFRIISTKKRN